MCVSVFSLHFVTRFYDVFVMNRALSLCIASDEGEMIMRQTSASGDMDGDWRRSVIYFYRIAAITDFQMALLPSCFISF